MKVLINGNPVDLPEGMTLAELVAHKALNPATIITELNFAIIPKDRWPETALKENDRLEIVTFVGGG
ncbi:thiamine biosynthesis protein ThiS [Thermosinus carboxydivorans Nor1]|uniref:Thiamine biosynthesis protein ThiS n=1 Tax=Thermosinus carboxydivorans Nor1 TaxID=401526 RepID=A1HPQ7_9FIRM|nr:sulfur carrier protein ThiS [Thermosinus carboxydivorans]EAX48027.1 thiamine biosynthesis protein ThiS [Thermosinus carboxydivorans Nor1]